MNESKQLDIQNGLSKEEYEKKTSLLNYPPLAFEFDDKNYSMHSWGECSYQLYLKKHAAEFNEINLIKKIINKDDVFYDIGANVGIFSILLNQDVKETFSFEPYSIAYSYLRRNLELNNLETHKSHQLALNDVFGDVFLYVNPEFSSGLNSLMPSQHPSARILSKETVPSTTLDKFIESNPAPSFCKIDVEGAEKAIFKGATQTIKKAKPTFFYETSIHTTKAFGYVPDDCELFLSQFDFKFYEFDSQNNELSDIDDEKKRKSMTLAVHPDSLHFKPVNEVLKRQRLKT